MFVAIDVFVVVRNVLLLYTFVETSYHHTEDVTPKQITPNNIIYNIYNYREGKEYSRGKIIVEGREKKRNKMNGMYLCRNRNIGKGKNMALRNKYFFWVEPAKANI